MQNRKTAKCKSACGWLQLAYRFSLPGMPGGPETEKCKIAEMENCNSIAPNKAAHS